MRKCEIEDCERGLFSKGMCCLHYTRQRRHGSTQDRRFRQTYTSQHRWLRQHFGSASLHDCSVCFETADEWAFIKEWCPEDQLMMGQARKDFYSPFSNDPSHYLTLCKTHHRQLDAGYMPSLDVSNG